MIHTKQFTQIINDIPDPEVDVLTDSLLHKVFLFFEKFKTWAAWQLMAAGVAAALLLGAVWAGLLGVQAALIVAGLQFGFFLVDTAVLTALPRHNISFGPWQPQLVVLTIPRWLASLGLLLLAPFGLAVPLALTVGVQLLATGLLIYAAVFEIHRLQLTALSVKSPNLPTTAPPIKVLHISDLHIEKWTKRESNVLKFAQEANPDLIIISGDYVNTSYQTDPDTHAIVHRLLSQLRAPHGVFAVFGTPPVDLKQHVAPIFDDLPHITIMRHHWELVDLGEGRQIAIMGLDCTHHLQTDAARLERLYRQVPAHLPKLFVYHSPEMMPQAVQHGIDLYLCGHTHGGQVRLPLLGPILTSSQLGRAYVMGHYQENDTNLYVSRGIGLEGMCAPRVRLLCPPEMTLVTWSGK